MAFRLPSANTTLSLYNGYIPGIFLDVHVISLLQSRVDYSSDGPRCLRQPSSRQPTLSYSPKTFFPSLDSTSASPVHPHCVFGQTTEDHHILRSSFASLHVPLGPHIPSASSLRVFRRPTYSLLVLSFNAQAAWSSRTFSIQTERGVPNSSPSDPRSETREGCGFDLMGAAGARSATLRAGHRNSRS